MVLIGVGKKYKIKADTETEVTRTGPAAEIWTFNAPNSTDFRVIGGDTYILYKGGTKHADGNVLR